jgi:hypothetical protein
MCKTWLALPLLTFAACAAPITIETRVVIREPQDVTLEAGPERRTVLPPGATENAALLGEGRIPTGDASSSDYSVTAIREPGGDIQLRWDTRLALVAGELQRLTPEDHTFVLNAPASWVVSSRGGLRLEQCATLSGRYQRIGARGPLSLSGYAPAVHTWNGEYDAGCESAPGRVGYTLATPWQNVAEITETRTPTYKTLSLAVLPMTLTEIGCGIYLLARPHGSGLSRAAGGGLALLGLAVQVPLSSSMFARTHERRIPVPRLVPLDQ